MTNSCEVVIVGAGAAGLGAALRLRAAGCDVRVLEARARPGGRAFTLPTPAGVPVDLGCEWLHHADRNPWVPIARRLGFTLDETLPDWGRRVSWTAGQAAEAEWMAARAALDAAYDRAAESAADRSAAVLLPPGGRWNALLGAISTWANGTELARVSVKDHARYAESDLNWRVLEGYGTLIATYGAGLPLSCDTVVTRIDHGGGRLGIETSRGTIAARAAIVTVPTNLLAAEAIRFTPALPDKAAAAAGLPLGNANKLFLGLDETAPALPRGRHLIGSLERVATGNYQLRPHGWPVISAYFGGNFAAVLEAEGVAGMTAFAIDELAGLLGSAIRPHLKPLAASAWVGDPFARGSYSCALPGHADDRARLAEPVDGRLFFAGEACSREYFGTAHGALLSGLAAAEQVLAACVPSSTRRPAP